MYFSLYLLINNENFGDIQTRKKSRLKNDKLICMKFVTILDTITLGMSIHLHLLLLDETGKEHNDHAAVVDEQVHQG